jgi:cation diffusion facilitator family transporter
MSSFRELIKKGNTSSLYAALGNTAVSIAKGVGAVMSGSGAMFASTMHSIADTINQYFVFAGSVLAERQPTKRFPTGFGRVTNVFCMVAVMVVSVMAYETILEGIHLISHPAEATNFWLNFVILVISISIDGNVLVKAMQEILHDARVEKKAKGLGVAALAFRNVGKAAPATRLVFYEDLVATSGSALALMAIVIAQFTSFKAFDGIATLLIGCLMVMVAFKVGYENLVGLIGVAAPADVEERVVGILCSAPQVVEVNRIRVIQEGRAYHVDGLLELKTGLSLAEAEDIKFHLKAKLLEDPGITDVTLGICEDNGIQGA